MMMQDKQRIIALSVAVALLLWGLDAAIDALFFNADSFLSSLFAPTGKEIYFRAFLLLGLLSLGVVISHVVEKRREAEERCQNIVELSSDIIYTSDQNGNLLFMNDAAFRILGYEPGEIIGRPFTDLLHPNDRKKTLEKRAEMAKLNVDTVNFENRYMTRSGRAITVLHNVRVRRNKNGEFIGTQGIARDISLRKIVEEESRRAMNRLADEKARSESILASVGDGIGIVDPDYKVIYQNQAHKEMVRGDKTGEFCYRAFAGGDSVCPGCPIAESFVTGGIHTLEKTVMVNNESRTLEIKASPLRDFSGKTVAGIETVRDITGRRKTQEKLKLFSEAIEEAMDGIQIVDLGGVIVYSNKAVREIYGYAPDELLGRHVNDMNADKRFAEQSILPSIRETGRWNGEIMVVHKDGSIFPIWLSTSMVKDETGTPIAMVGIIRDITQRKQAERISQRHREQLVRLVEERTGELSRTNEKLRREIADREKMEEELVKAKKLESLGVLAGGIAHDFNNLLSSILGNIGLAMLDLDSGHRAVRQLESAEKASLRAQDLTRQLLTFSRGGTPVKKATDIGELVKESAGFALRGSRGNFEFSVSDDLRLVDVDEGQMTQVIHNLVINADQAMPEGGTIEIRCCNAARDDDALLPEREHGYVRVSIEDSGVGIPPEHLSKIFDPYFTTKQRGSGLGLATTYSIIHRHGGRVTVESEQGKGTIFHLYLPALRETKLVKKIEDRNPLKGKGAILVMDDEAEVRETTGAILTRLGYDVEYAGDGEEAIERYRAAGAAGRPFDLVIMDLTVPGGLGGHEALKRLREIDPRIKAIVSSGYSDDPVMADFRKYGFSAVVTKPFRVKELSEVVHRVLAGQA